MAENTTNTIETPVEIINQTIDKVSKILQKEFPEHLNFKDGSFTLTHGSTQVMVIVRPFTDDEACVECLSNVVTGAKIDAELMKFLLRSNAQLHFGSFGLLFDDTITYSHSFSAACLDDGELEITVSTIAAIADYYDDLIVEKAGGQRAIDLIEELKDI